MLLLRRTHDFEECKRNLFISSLILLLLSCVRYFPTCQKGGFRDSPTVSLDQNLSTSFSSGEEDGWYIDLVGFESADTPRATDNLNVGSNVIWYLDNSYGHNNVSIQIGRAKSFDKLEVHPILQAEGLIPDPQHGYNEISHVAWIRSDTWKFTARFQVPKDLQTQNTFIEMNQIDTIGTVLLNGKFVGNISNMHRKYIFPLDSGLFSTKLKHMELSITLFSPVTRSEELFHSQNYKIPHAQQKFGIGHFNMIRKAASDFGWDWGPAMVPFGILGHVVLISTPCSSVLESIITRQNHLSDTSVAIHIDLIIKKVFRSMERIQSVRVDIFLSPPKSKAGSAELQNSTTAFCKPVCGPYDSFRDTNSHQCLLKCTGASINVNKPSIWSSWDHSSVKKQPLYMLRVNVSLIFIGNKRPQPIICRYSRIMSIGLRSIQLRQDPVQVSQKNHNTIAESFYFRLNGNAIYSRGANLVPLSLFESNVSKESMEKLLWSVKAAGMNMIRVWGGGRYLNDHFYYLCDRMGIMIWQEMMFSCALYPSDINFTQNIAEEVRQHMISVLNHPSVVMIGFNNENENSFEWFQEAKINPQRYSDDYHTLFIEYMRQILLEIMPETVNFVDSSPSNGVWERDPIYRKRWGSTSSVAFGDIHFYNYDSNMINNKTVYPAAKFVSEYGFMSLPSYSVYSSFVDEEDLENPLEMLKFRTRHQFGLAQMFEQMQMHFWKFQCNHSVSSLLQQISGQNLPSFIYLSQLQQALIYEAATVRWRREMAPNSTMGILYWQLNDVWAGTSWSSINADLSWKMLHSSLRNYFSPFSIMVDVTYGGSATGVSTIHFYASNHKLHSTQVNVEISLIPYSAQRESDRKVIFAKNITAGSQGYMSLHNLFVEEAESTFLYTAITSRSGEIISFVSFPSEIKDARLNYNTSITVTAVLSAKHGKPIEYTSDCPRGYHSMFSVVLSSSNGISLLAFLESILDIIFIENAVTVFPWESRVVPLCSREGLRLSEINLNLVVTWLQRALDVTSKSFMGICDGSTSVDYRKVM